MNQRYGDDIQGEGGGQAPGPENGRAGPEHRRAEPERGFLPGNHGFRDDFRERRPAEQAHPGQQTPGQYERGPLYDRSRAGQRRQGDPYAQGDAAPPGRYARYERFQPQYGDPRYARFEDRSTAQHYGPAYPQGRWHDPLSQRPFGHSPFSHSDFTESDAPHYFGTGSQGFGGGPTFTGGPYGHADEHLDSPYFPEAGFNRGYYGDAPDRYFESPYGNRSFGRVYGDPWHGHPGAPRPRNEPTRRRYPPGPKGYQRSDERLREDISERLMHSEHIDSSEVTVDVLGGKVILDGTVPDRYMKHAIEDLADSAPGVQDIENRIRVVAGSGVASHAPEVHGG